MKSFLRWVDRFCARHPRFGIFNLMKYLIIGNVAVWLLAMMDTTGTVIYYLSFNPKMVLQGEIWRLVSFVFIPNSLGLTNLLFLYFYYFIGNVLEQQWGSVKFNFYFYTGMLLTVIYGFIAYAITGQSMSVGAHYIYLSMFFAFATYYPDTQVLLFFIVPIKIKWLALIDAAFFVYGVATTSFPANLLPLVAVVNYLLFCGELLLPALHLDRAIQRKKINFRQQVSQLRYEQKNAPYRFQCAVCGRTDVSNPELEFRYCSRCAGYHCFCQDHINNHIHFTE